MIAGRGTVVAGDGGATSPPGVTSADVANVLSRSTFRALAAAHPRISPAQVHSLSLFAAALPDAPLAELFDAAYATSARKFRTEYYYKNLIVSRIIFGRHSPSTASALVELGAGASIADVVVLNGTTTAYEIKTDFDDFARLPAQLSDYRACFERTYVVVSESRSARAVDQVPAEFGVIAVGARGYLSELRPARGGLDGLRPEVMFKMLHQSEVLEVLADTLGYTVDVPPAKLWSRTVALFSSLPVEVSHHHTTRHLRLRGQRAGKLATKVPVSLRARAYDIPVSRVAGARITRRLEENACALLV